MSDKNDSSKLPSDFPKDPLAALTYVAKKLAENVAPMQQAARQLHENAATLQGTEAIAREANVLMRQTAGVARQASERMQVVADATRTARDLMTEIRDRCTAAEAHFRNASAILSGNPPAPPRIPSLRDAQARHAAGEVTSVPRLAPPRPAARVAARTKPPAPPSVRRPVRSADTARLDSLIAFPKLGTPPRGQC